jgi:hypothetical protein
MRMLTIEEAAPILSSSSRSLYRSIERHKLPVEVVRICSAPRLPWLDVALLAAFGGRR